ncbi:MAG: bifunctional metallophosphatase/5'-nucleotidase [Selenomonadaceae bacterium]|nr:bifunctional metallophosphatase/5'-nucleotidase [Selenomonadaceae bacterium]
MKKFLMAVILLIFFVPRGVSAEEIIIFHTNDSHSRILNSDDSGASIGLAEMAAAVKTVKKQNKLTYWFDAGDTLHGMPRINISNGENIVPLLNAAGIDVLAPGNHDFNYGSDQLEILAKKLKFPVLAANVVRKSNGAAIFQPYKIFKQGKIKIGVFGLATPETAYKAAPVKVQKVEFLNPVESARKMIKILRPQCDVLICVMHMGLDASSEFTSERIAAETEGIDVIIDGHSHTELPEGLTVKNTLIAQTGNYEHFLGQVKINLRDGEIISKTAKLLTAEDVKKINPTPDKRITNQIIKIEKKNKKIFDVVVAHSDRELNGARELVRRQESEIGNLCADALRWKTGADIAIMNGGGIRAGLPSGDITRGDILEIAPFGNTLQKAEISGKVLRETLEHSVFGVPAAFGGFLSVSGMTFTFDSSKPAGQRVEEIFINGVPLDENKIYTIGAVDFMLMGGDDYTMLKDLKIVGEYETLDDVFTEYLNNHGVKDIELGRIKNLAENVDERQAA